MARTDTFMVALMIWLFGLLFLGAYTGAGALGVDLDGNVWKILIGVGVLAMFFTWLLLTRVRLVQRMSERMSQWGLGVAQLTLFAYLLVMPIYVVIAAFDRD
jgi:hypothetical protein